MPKCEECGKEVSRRVTHVEADSRKKVCVVCDKKLGMESYRKLCEFIIGGKVDDKS